MNLALSTFAQFKDAPRLFSAADVKFIFDFPPQVADGTLAVDIHP